MSAGEFPVLFGPTGPIATPPATIQQVLINNVAACVPSYTAVLPASLIEDMSSTAVGAIIAIDQARVDAINSVTPYGSNPYILAQQGFMFGLPPGTVTNGEADVVFTGTVGFVLPPGFIVGDGTNQYTVDAPGTVIGSGGTSPQTTVTATTNAVFAIPANSVNQIVTALPAGVTCTVTNPQAGTPAQSGETVPAYRSRLLTAYQVGVTGSFAYLKTLLYAVPGVQTRLVSVLQNGSQWEVICGGGDVYGVGYAIYQGVSSLGLLTGSSIDPTRDVNVSIFDAPDIYNVEFVNPPQQVVTLAVTWNTNLPNFTAGAAVNQYIILAGQSYINSVVVGQGINLLELNQTVQEAISPVLNPVNLTTLQYVVTINSVITGPTAGTSIIPSDPESYFFVSPTGVTSTQG